jgi:hypothetical protein
MPIVSACGEDRCSDVWPMPRLGELAIRENWLTSCGLCRQVQVADRVLDLGAVVELRAADDLVADLAAHERVLEDPGLRVRPVEDRDLVARRAGRRPSASIWPTT